MMDGLAFLPVGQLEDGIIHLEGMLAALAVPGIFFCAMKSTPSFLYHCETLRLLVAVLFGIFYFCTFQN